MRQKPFVGQASTALAERAHIVRRAYLQFTPTPHLEIMDHPGHHC